MRRSFYPRALRARVRPNDVADSERGVEAPPGAERGPPAALVAALGGVLALCALAIHLRRGGAASAERADGRHAPRRDAGPADDDAHNPRAARFDSIYRTSADARVGWSALAPDADLIEFVAALARPEEVRETPASATEPRGVLGV